jgi:hypothetical protein
VTPVIAIEGQRSVGAESHPRARLAAVLGTGRSGTTWLGAILKSHPEVIYRFEPFHRLKDVPRIAGARDILVSPGCGEAALEKVRSALLPADPEADKPPFFSRSGGSDLGRMAAWSLARRLKPAAAAYRRIYRARAQGVLVFKEVSMEKHLGSILGSARVPVVYLVRHPMAVVASTIKGQNAGAMPVGRLGVLESLLTSHDSTLAARFVPRLGSLGPAASNALLWRIDVEKGVSAVRGVRHARLVIYENLCRDPQGVVDGICTLFGLPAAPAVTRFIRESTTPEASRKRRLLRGDALSGGYFSVYRDPRRSMDKWKDELSADQVRDIRAVVEDSPVFQRCAELGAWE